MSIPERWKGFKPLPPDIEERLQRLTPLFEREGVRLAYLFGSLNNPKGDRAPNDVDLALLTSGTSALDLWVPISEALGTERLDIANLRIESPLNRFEILRTGRPLYVADADEQQRWEMATIREYQDTAYLRRKQGEYLRRSIKQWVSTGIPSKRA